MTSRTTTTIVRFGVRVRNGDAALTFAPKGWMGGKLRGRHDRGRPLTVCEGLAFRGETLDVNDGWFLHKVCSVDAAAPARVVARLGDVYRARVAWMQQFVDSHALTESEKEQLARIIAKAKGVKGRVTYDVKAVA